MIPVIKPGYALRTTGRTFVWLVVGVATQVSFSREQLAPWWICVVMAWLATYI